jgi:hypothetical protein
MRDFLAPAHKRIRILSLLLIGIMVIFIIRLGIMQFIYQNDVVTFAQLDQTVRELNGPIIEEVKSSFDVNLKNFHEVNIDQVINSGNKDKSTLSLLDTMSTSCQEGCIGQPTAYLNETKGFLFYKNKDGDNFLLELKQENGIWEVVHKQKSAD